MRIPLATYRLQFNRHFTFSQAVEVADYLRDLGISDVYASPLFQAGPQSTHGYDVCAFDQFNPNLGSAADFDRFATRLRDLGLGLLLDMVPNHMGAVLSNPWWLDVLEKGRASPYASWFDIDWQPPGCNLRDKVLLPILEAPYAQVLEAGKLRLGFDSGAFFLTYYDRRFPLSPESQATLLNESSPNDASRNTQHASRNTQYAPRITPLLQRLNGQPGAPRSFDPLHALLQQQHYRLAYWRVGPEEINYRRFFDITDLVSLRMELPEVFQAAHTLVFDLLRQNKITGLRVDHPDGLWNPKQYFDRLQTAAASFSSSSSSSKPPGESRTSKTSSIAQSAAFTATRNTQHATRNTPPLYLVAEKILTADEPLPSDWSIAGTTGYDFLNRLNGLFVNGANRQAFDSLYCEFTACPLDFQSVVYASKSQILRASLISELQALAHRLKRLAAATRYGQDFTFNQLYAALAAIIAAFPVYRTYATEQTAALSDAENGYVLQAVQLAQERSQRLDPAVFKFIKELLLLHPPADLDVAGCQLCREFVLRFQQLTGPVMAKGLEDTAFYNFNRLVSLNEVGGNPDAFGVAPQQFHDYNLSRLEQWPHSLLATATHDTKRGEDARARLNLLSEIPEDWRQAIARWSRLNAGKKSLVDGQPAPHPNDEYLLYQALLGAWPPGPPASSEAKRSPATKKRPNAAPSINSINPINPINPTDPVARDSAALRPLRERLTAYMLKAIKEAKTRTSWTEPNAAYETATTRFVEALLADSTPNLFLDDFKPFQRRVAFFGQFNSLSQVILKLTSPGVPDLYQGTELWDFSLVDPDNRRPVDYDLRRRLLAELKAQFERIPLDLSVLLRQLLQESETGQIKQFLIWRTLQFRQRHRELFDQGHYWPLYAVGPQKNHLCAFARILEGQECVVVAPRLLVGLTRGAEHPPLGRDVWQDTLLLLPHAQPGAQYRNVLTHEVIPSTPTKSPPQTTGLGSDSSSSLSTSTPGKARKRTRTKGRSPEAQSNEVHPALPLAAVLALFPVALLEPVAGS